MKRIEHVELRIGPEELRERLGLPKQCLIEALEPFDAYQGLAQAQMNQGRGTNVIPPRRGNPVEELRITFTRDQEKPV